MHDNPYAMSAYDQFITDLYYLRDIRKVDISELSILELDEVYLDSFNTKMDMFFFGLGMAETALLNSGKTVTAKSVIKPALRLEYEAAVRSLAERVARLRAAGISSEAIAREISAARRALGVKYKHLTPKKKLAEIYARNLAKYKDKLGPSVEWLRAHGKSWDDIIESACRPGGQDLNF
jgi:hypothetical protein